MSESPYQLLVFDWNGTLSTGLIDLDHPIISPLFPGVVDMLKHLSQTYHLAVATFASRQQLTMELERYDIADCFSVLACGDDGPRKPEALVLTQLTDELGIKLSQTLMIGDTEADLCCAENAGIDSIAVNVHGADWLHNHSPKASLDSITDLPMWLAADASR